MELELTLRRTYYPNGTNGIISIGPASICHSIELPWKDNKRKTSCIPEGRYLLTRYESPKHGPCLLVNNVPGRSMCELHEANWAMGKDGKHPQLEGCIAPVTTLEPGKAGVGWRSGDAVNRIEGLVFPVLRKGGKAWLNVVKA